MLDKYIPKNKGDSDELPTFVELLPQQKYSTSSRAFFLLLTLIVICIPGYVSHYIFWREHELSGCPVIWHDTASSLLTQTIELDGLSSVCQFGATEQELFHLRGRDEDFYFIREQNFSFDPVHSMLHSIMPEHSLIVRLDYRCAWGYIRFFCPIEYKVAQSKRDDPDKDHYLVPTPTRRPYPNGIWIVTIVFFLGVLIITVCCIACCTTLMTLLCCCRSFLIV
jgi:hypothetical protein